MIIYLSGAITGTSDARERFAKYAELLSDFTVLNPQRILEPLESCCDTETILSVCGRMIDMCDCIALIPGWEGSHGCNWEIDYASQKRIPVFRIGKVENGKVELITPDLEIAVPAPKKRWWKGWHLK